MNTKTKKKAECQLPKLKEDCVSVKKRKKRLKTEILFEEEYRYQWRNRH